MKYFARHVMVVLALSLLWGASASAQSTDAGENSGKNIEAAKEALVDVLNDPESRARLIEFLKENKSEPQGTADESVPPGTQKAPADTTGAGESSVDADADAEATKPGMVLRIGEYTKEIAADVGEFLERVLRSLEGLLLVFSGEIQIKWERAEGVLLQVAVVLGSAYATFFVARVVAQKIYPRLATRARYGGALARTGILVFSSAIDALTVALGLAVGYFVALSAYGGFAAGVTIQESLALNAFFVTGMANVGLRFVFAPKRPELRLLPFDDFSADYWSGRLGLFMYWINYGVLLAVPVANIAVSFVLGNALRVLIVLVGMLYLVVLVARNRERVRRGTKSYAETLHSVLAQHALANLGNLWHLAAYTYIAAVFIVWVTRPFDATTIILRATGQSILTIMAGMAISMVVTRAIKRGIRLPAELNKRLPALQYRLNAFVPRLLKIVRFAVFLATLLLLLDIWGLVSAVEWFYSETGLDLVSRYGSAFFMVIVGFVIWLAVMSWVDLRLQSRAGYIVTARERTLFQLFRNAFTVVIIVMVTLVALSEIGLEIGPLIAGAGVVGLAISFGAQTLVKDIITGAFIQIENAINEGDVVTVAGITGTVEGITVRSVRLRDLEGTTHIIPFSSVDMVSNFMRGFSYHVALIGVSYDTNVAYAKEAMGEAFRRLLETDFKSRVLGELEMHGVTNFGASSIDIRARIKTTPGDQWSVGRAYNEFIKQVFDERDIEIPFPQVTYHRAAPPFDGGSNKSDVPVTRDPKPRALKDDAPPD